MAHETLSLTIARLARLGKKIPEPIHRLASYVFDKYTGELAFQAQWAEEFNANKGKVLDYWKRYRYLDNVVSICGISDSTRVLDVGCGISTVLHFIQGIRVGIDPLADEYKRLYHYPDDIKIQKAPGETIPFPDASFDVVFCSNVLDHVTDPKKTLGEIQRVLNNRGKFLLTVEIFKESVKRNPAHPHSLTRDNVDALLRDTFAVVFEKESPWIGMRNYVLGKQGTENRELILVLQKL